ncbi:sodium/sulphate symporter [Methylobacterium sp. 4-46]|uniref:SLC13 family permease n=1 Tax=unclassified Methylobacterium TaxID=2615210 RepID=UPI000152D5DB|nr:MULTISPECIES: SLC13 family permease [Methylobacterium]ACA20582.1 sodium/sulphate symporter [Methylobacterium sp. 4-46]WFT79747.1 SLC13 family permease [Methylobacterium nodulans]
MGPALAPGSLLLPGLIALGTILLWATARLPEYLTALLFFAAAMVLRAAPADAVFAGFQSAAFWLVLSGFVIGTAIRKVGLADRVARALAPHLSGSWPRLVGGTVALAYALAFVMPSNMGRIALLMPIVMALSERCGLAEPGRIALALAVGFGTYELSASILPANVPNLVMAGAAESAYGLHVPYLSYLALHAPVLGVLKGLVLTACLCALFRATPRPVAPEQAAPLSPAERRLALLLAATLILWATDALHGVPPAWIGLAAACLCLLPRIGFLSGEDFAAGVNIRTCLYIAGVLGLAALVARTGLGDAIGREVLAVLPRDPARPALGFAGVLGLVTVLNFTVTGSAAPALFTPLARALADGTGLPLAAVVMAQVIGYATPLLPYQAAPVVVAMGMAGVPARAGLIPCLAVALVTFVLLAPLDYAWFRLLGWIP